MVEKYYYLTIGKIYLLHCPPALLHGKILMSSSVAMLKIYSYSTVLHLLDQEKY
jgi:hypothetical protein